MISAYDLISMYLDIELQSLCLSNQNSYCSGKWICSQKFFFGLWSGGAERLAVDAALEMCAQGHDVHVFTAHHDKKRCFEETIDGILRPVPLICVQVIGFGRNWDPAFLVLLLIVFKGVF